MSKQLSNGISRSQKWDQSADSVSILLVTSSPRNRAGRRRREQKSRLRSFTRGTSIGAYLARGRNIAKLQSNSPLPPRSCYSRPRERDVGLIMSHGLGINAGSRSFGNFGKHVSTANRNFVEHSSPTTYFPSSFFLSLPHFFLPRRCIGCADTPRRKRSRKRSYVTRPVVLTENGEFNGGPHGPVYGYRRVVGLAGVIHLIIVRRGHDGNGTVSVVLEQLLARLPGLALILVCNIRA